MTVKTGYAVTSTVNGEVIPNFTTEKANNNTTLGKMIVLADALLNRTGVKGTGGVVGTYDPVILGEACYKLYHGSRRETVYGNTLEASYFEVAKLL
jgi:hypothetical protein